MMESKVLEDVEPLEVESAQIITVGKSTIITTTICTVRH